MNSVDGYVGQTLDEKYRLERLLGQGGMGAVYLATHLGTGRSVAVKLIMPALMRRRVFVERFKREARAAGRLRHPNIVDVTDFGFALSGTERIAYLAMEYLDGCTLHEVLEEERIIPLPATVEILDQVCSAVHEAHRQGIVHRDLKPENIWLEPNRLGGYRVKVLDFGIAKVAEGQQSTWDEPAEADDESPTADLAEATATVTDLGNRPEDSSPQGSESATLLEPGGAIFEAVPEATPRTADPVLSGMTPSSDPQRLRVANAATMNPTGSLTLADALVGTPRFMSPEQCRGAKLDARSDIYSLGVIAYQMLAGCTPFNGDSIAVIRAHLETPPPPLRERNRRLPPRVSAVILSALAKDPSARPPSALAFANALRANATGLGALYRRAFALYSEHFPKIMMLSVLAHIPVLAGVLLTIGAVIWESQITNLGLGIAAVLRLLIAVLSVVASFVATSAIAGVTAILVTQLEVAPLRQWELRTAFELVRQRWRPFLRTGVIVSVKLFFGFFPLVIPGMVLLARNLFWAPIVLMEGLEGKAAQVRSRVLASRSWPAIATGVVFLVLVDQLTRWLAGRLIGLETLPEQDLRAKVLSKLVPLVSILYLPLLSIVPALLYLKMREMGGETLIEIMAPLEAGVTRSRWEQRLRARLPVPTPPQST